MRKLGTDEAIEKKRRNNFIISIFFLAILVLSTLGYALIFSPNQNTNEQPSSQQTDFTKSLVQFEGQQFFFSYPKEEVSEISVPITLTLDNYVSSLLYVDSNNKDVNSELAQVFTRYSSRIQKACYGKCEEDIPEKDCSSNLIIWRESTENTIRQEQNCVFINGDLRAVDAFLYKLLGLN